MSQSISELERRLHAMIQLGTIAEVDHARGLARVAIGKRVTDWLRVPGLVGANYRGWTPLRVGTQVLLCCPSGDPAAAVITQLLYSAALPQAADTGTVDVIVWDDGTRAQYDSASRTLTIETPGAITVHAAQAVTLASDGDMRLRAGGTLHIDAAAVRVFEGG